MPISIENLKSSKLEVIKNKIISIGNNQYMANDNKMLFVTGFYTDTLCNNKIFYSTLVPIENIYTSLLDYQNHK